MWQTFQELAQQKTSRLGDLLAGVTDQAGSFTQGLVIALIVLIIAIFIARFVRNRLRRFDYLGNRDPAVGALLTNVVYASILFIGIIVALQTGFNLNLGALITALGLSGLAFSLALQDVLRNFVAGIYILLEKPFSLGDRIELKDIAGDVLRVDLRTTRLRAGNGEEVIVPNSALMTEVVTNRSLQDYWPYVVNLKGTRDTLIDRVEYLRGILQTTEGIAQHPPPEVVIETMDASQTALKLRFHVPRSETSVASLVAELESQLPHVEITAQLDGSG